MKKAHQPRLSPRLCWPKIEHAAECRQKKSFFCLGIIWASMLVALQCQRTLSWLLTSAPMINRICFYVVLDVWLNKRAASLRPNVSHDVGFTSCWCHQAKLELVRLSSSACSARRGAAHVQHDRVPVLAKDRSTCFSQKESFILLSGPRYACCSLIAQCHMPENFVLNRHRLQWW